MLKWILENYEGEENIKEAILSLKNKLSPKHIILDDIIASISYILNLTDGIGFIDDIDHLEQQKAQDRRELLQNQFRIGLARMERVIKRE